MIDLADCRPTVEAAEVRSLALAIMRERYADFSLTLAAERLPAHHGCMVSRETLRG